MPSDVARHNHDRVDRAIVSRLQVDGRLPNVELAEAISLSPSACLRRVKALEAGGIIAGYRAEVDRVRAGLGLTVFIELKVEGHSRETSAQLEATLTAIPAVVACYLISGSPARPASSSRPPAPTWPSTSRSCSIRSWPFPRSSAPRALSR